MRSSASALCTLLNSYAAQLTELYENTEAGLAQDVETVNGIFNSIRDLNESIRKSEIHGDNALELRDERNNLIDELSRYMKIDVIYTEEDVGAGLMVEKLTIKLADANPDPKVHTDESILIDGIYGTQMEVSDDGKYTVSLFLVGSKDVQYTIDANNPETLKSLTLTRVGNFEFKADGYLSDNNGNVVYGFLCTGYDENGVPQFSDQLVPICNPPYNGR